MKNLPSSDVIIGSNSGDPDEQPQRSIFIKGFSIGVNPVTQDLYEMIMGENPSFFRGERRPVECISWYDSVIFANRLSEYFNIEPYYRILKNSQDEINRNAKDGKKWQVITLKNNGFRLLYDDEREYATGDSSLKNSWFEVNSEGRTHDVGEMEPNCYGLNDMLGNVSEWCFNWYLDGNDDYIYRSQRGGSWYDDTYPLRKTYKGRYNPDWKNYTIGFRLARSI